MLTLLLLRHAKAVQHMADGDFARTLTDKGAADAAALGIHLAATGLVPDFAYVSAATRTLQTFERVGAAFTPDVPFASEAELYNATAGELRDRLRSVRPEVRTLMMVGHNPGIMEAAMTLARDGDPTEVERMRGRFPPCSVAVLTFAANDWLDARSSGGRLDLFLTPDDIAAAA